MKRSWLGVLWFGCLVACTGELSTAKTLGSGDGAQSDEAPEQNSSDGSGGTAGAAPTDPAQPQSGPYLASSTLARRLTRAELDNAMRDMFGDDSGAASRLLPEDPYAPYDNAYLGQQASGALIDALVSFAEDVAGRVLGDANMRDNVVPCAPSGPGDAACFRKVIEQLTRRAFRRPLETAETERYLTLLSFATEDNADVENGFDTAVALLMQAVLMDPEFLYRVEVGSKTGDPGVYALSNYEIATRLSFLLWGTVPDQALLDDAAAGRLDDGDGRMAATRRMMADPRARTQVQRFHAMWLGYRAVPHGASLADAFQRETAALIDRVVFDQPQAYTNLFTFSETYIDDQLAEHYGLPLPGQETWVAYDDSGRAGLLSHGSFLSAFGKFSDTSPTQRGILVRERLLCQTIAPPPPTIMADQPPGDGDAVCKFDRYAAHRQSASCAACHSQMDPIGFGLERYDLAGRYREHDEGLPECAIEGQGNLPPYGTFSGPAELAQVLLDSGELSGCVVKQFMTFALGRPPSGNEHAEVERLTEDVFSGGGQFTDLLQAHVASDAFALRFASGEVTP